MVSRTSVGSSAMHRDCCSWVNKRSVERGKKMGGRDLVLKLLRSSLYWNGCMI